MDWLFLLNVFNSIFWVAANMTIIYIGVTLLAFLFFYYRWFDPKVTTAGQFIFRFTMSLLGIIALVFIGIFIDPRASIAWFTYPGDVIWWRPAVRLLAYGYVAYTVTGLAVLIYMRKFHPHRLRTARDREMLTPRAKTGPIDIL